MGWSVLLRTSPGLINSTTEEPWRDLIGVSIESMIALLADYVFFDHPKPLS
jgi:hypothetical protein